MNNPNQHTPSDEQIRANRANAQKSIGPRTAEGKAASSRNSIPRPPNTNQHLLEPEDPGEFFALLQDHFQRFQPVGEAEEKLVLHIALAQWRLDRATPLEAGLYRDRFQDVAREAQARALFHRREKENAEHFGDPPPPEPPTPDPGDLLALAFSVDCITKNSFTKLARYESHLERSIDRSLRQLQRYQAARNQPVPGPDDSGDSTTNPKNGGIGIPANGGSRPAPRRRRPAPSSAAPPPPAQLSQDRPHGRPHSHARRPPQHPPVHHVCHHKHHQAQVPPPLDSARRAGRRQNRGAAQSQLLVCPTPGRGAADPRALSRRPSPPAAARVAQSVIMSRSIGRDCARIRIPVHNRQATKPMDENHP